MCSSYSIDSALIKNLHFFDLQSIIIDCQIDKVKEYLKAKKQHKEQKDGIETRHIEGKEVLNYL
jgi:hypothetical protein